MPTPAEQKALTFVALVILLGAGARVVSGGALAAPGPTPAEQQGLLRQAVAASSSAVLERTRTGQKKSNTRRTAPRRRHDGASFDSTGVLTQGTGVVSASGFPPPGPRIDVDSRARAIPADRSGRPRAPTSPAPPGGEENLQIDLDQAAAVEIERLPGIGPALARRIVASRDSLGPFGTMAGLGRVKGVGPATLQRVARLVTFSGQARR